MYGGQVIDLSTTGVGLIDANKT